ncbi:hypothetical protein [Microtetraspora niveoalba]|uniref:hypothetical protein n=1 Tax=Microtetraspora niveoalba TaxID=46175 RepID=UPI000834F9A2|nr:hypothetical protein [Microtetraspora niveoalba]
MSVVTFQADSRTETALAELTADGQAPDEVIREAIVMAWRLRRAETARREAVAAGDDPDDREEARAIMRDMESLRAW